MLLLTLVLAVAPAGAPERFLFRGPADWVVVDGAGKVVSRFASLGGLQPVDAALAPDGLRVAFTAHGPEAGAGGPLLYEWDGARATLLSQDDGYHAAPAYAPDGRTLAFVHHPGAGGGPPGQHGPGANAQVWLLDGTRRLTRLTESQGCKGNPGFAGPTRLYLNHNTCNGRQGLDVLTLRPHAGLAREAPVLPPTGYLSEPRLSPDGRLLAYTARNGEDSVVVVARADKPGTALARVPVVGQPPRLRLAWTRDSRRLLWAAEGAIWSLGRGGTGAVKLGGLDNGTGGGDASHRETR